MRASIVSRARRGIRGALINAGRILTELGRDPAMLGLTLLLPAFFMLLTVMGYSSEARPLTWKVYAEPTALAARPGLEGALRDARHSDGRPAFELRITDPSAAAAPSGGAVLVLRQGADGSLVLEGDALSAEYMAASNKLEELLDSLRPERSGEARLVQAALPYRSARSDFEAFAPGMMIFAVLMLIPQTAFLIGREARRGTIDRLSATGMGAASYLGGVALSQAAFAIAQGILLVVLAALFGYPFGNAPLAAAGRVLGILVLLSLSSVAQGLLVGAFAKSDSSAINIASVVAMLQVFLSGSFFPMPAPALVLAGRPGLDSYAAIGAYDAFPASHAIKALTRSLLDGGQGAGVPILAMAALALIYFALAAAFFGRKRMRAS